MDLKCIFLTTTVFAPVFSVLIWHPLWWGIFKNFFCLSKNWVVCSFTLKFESSLYIMDTCLLAYIWFANIYFQSVAYLFILFKGIFQRGEFFFILMKSDLSVCSFISCAFDVISKKSLPRPTLYIFFSLCSSEAL